MRATSRPRFRAGKLQIEPNGFQQRRLFIVKAIDVARIGIRRQEAVEIGCILVVLRVAVCPGNQLEQRQARNRRHADREALLDCYQERRGPRLFESGDVEDDISTWRPSYRPIGGGNTPERDEINGDRESGSIV